MGQGTSEAKGPRGWGGSSAWPLLLGVLSGCGLVLALVGDGAWDTASWLLLATPIDAVAWALVRPGAAP
ncbi:MAG TPA: hypothetical protein VFZ16_13515 [Hyphomicrobiaceae bacterium]|nr:hypothetical protein [Hyphomicrobiaceae bacterium]